MTARLVVTLPPGLAGDAVGLWARDARRRGADLIEIRTDLQPPSFDARRVSQVLPLIISERGQPFPKGWIEAASWIDRDVTQAPPMEEKALCSHHAEHPLSTKEALALWDQVRVPPGGQVKHVEPLGAFQEAPRLFETRRALAERYGAERVTVLAMGTFALPFRCLLSEENALEYVAASPDWCAAPGQRLLDDAVRSRQGRGPRLGILGTRIAHSRSPRIHRQPFDRLDLPADLPVASLLEALLPHYRGFAVTSPFKKAVAAHIRSPLESVNTLVRRGERYEGFNTDVAGARAVLTKLAAKEVWILGQGGIASALRLAGEELGVTLRFVRRTDSPTAPLAGAVVWTWPDTMAAPDALRFDGAKVAVVAYGGAARRLATEIARRGGHPVLLGTRWFVAQARRQRQLWENA